MSKLPPLPPGYRIEERPDPWTILQAEGFVATNGFRTEADVADIRAQGYKPAAGGAHNKGDGVDLIHPKLSPKQQERRLRQLAQEHGWNDAFILDEGHHRHLAIPGWGAAPGTPGTRNSGLPDLPDGFIVEKRGSLSGGNFTATGEATDGDTVRLSSGQNGRLFGADAYELGQQGRRPDGSLVPLGGNARNYLSGQVGPQTPVTFTGNQSYGRPVVSLGGNGDDPALDLLRHGHGLAARNYLQGSPQFGPYMEAERLARQNLLGGHGTNAETPEQFRDKSGPWQGAEPGVWGEGQAVFGDEPMPFMGLRPEIEQAYVALAQDPKATPADLLAFAKQHGFEIRPEDAQGFIQRRNSGKIEVEPEVVYTQLPPPVTDLGHGAPGAFARGIADPINLVDEIGGVAHALGLPTLSGPRENIWNSDRRFGDILDNNIDQNRSILAYDDMEHPIARFGGQIASGVALPYGAGIRTPVQLARLGAIEGGLAGFGAGEGNPVERAPNALLGAALGAGGGYVLGRGAQHIGRLNNFRRGDQAADVPTEPEAIAAMRMEDDGAELIGPLAPLERQRDYLKIGGEELPPMPQGFVLEEPFGVARPIGQRLSPEEMARLAEGVDPRSVLPRPSNIVESLDEAQRANPGRFAELQPPNALNELPVRSIPSRADLYKSTKVRGPLDVTQRLRSMGGIRDQGGELSHAGISNEPRRMDFGSNEQFIGKLIDNERGLPLDEATFRLWEEGYFPEFQTRPTPDDLLDTLKLEAMGQRRFHPEDQPLVERFYDARAEADRIGRAADEGAPLVDERGESINLDDLVANTPPAEAYEEMPRLTGKIGNINLGRLGRPQDVAQLIQHVSQRVGGFSAAARGRITHEETQRLAQELGVKPEQLLRRRQGQALNAEELYASRALVQRSRETVARMAQKAVGGDDDAKLAFRKAWLAHVGLEEQIAGATAEAGRALSQMRMLARAQDAGANAVRSYLKGIGGKEKLDDAAEAIVDLMEDPARAGHFMREAVKPRWRDKFNELWINSLLSGPRTHVVNFVGNALTTTLSFPEVALTAGIGKLTRSADRAYFSEVGARAAGLADSSIEALRAMRKAFATGEPSDEITKVEAVDYQAIGGRLGKVIRTPTRALTAADEFWGTLLRGAEMRQLAYRQAADEATDAADLQARYEALMRTPTAEMDKKATDAARYYTFRQPLGEAGRGVQQISNNWVGGKIVLPFVRTPINILKFAGERSVLGLAMPEVRAALKAGGRQRDEALGRITLGSGLSTAAVVAAMDGRITGSGPSDPRERSAWLEVNQPYSIKIGDQWVSYARFDPVSTLFGVAADFAEVGKWATKREADVLATELAISIARNLTNKTWLSGISDAFDVMSDPERFAPSWFRRMAGSAAVPSLVNQASQVTDPYLRDARTIVDAIKARVPVLSESIPARLNVWGEPVERGDAVGPDLVSPFYAKQGSRDPVKQEMARLRAPISMPQRSMLVDGQSVKLNPQQYGELVQMTGKAAKQYLDGFIQSPEWRSLSDDERREEVKELFEEFRAAARDELRGRYPELGGRDAEAIPPPPPGFELVP